MRKYMMAAVLCVAGLLVFVAAGSLFAGYDQAMGEIKSIDKDGGKIVVNVRAGRDDQTGKDTTFSFNEDTGVKINGEKKTVADLEVGKRVSITFKEGDPPVAVMISVFERPAGGGKGGKGGKGGGGAGGAGN